MGTELMGVDIINMLKMLNEEVKHPGLIIGSAIASSHLSKIAERALALKDAELIKYCKALYLLQEKKDGVENESNSDS
jgi:hypothetical protein